MNKKRISIIIVAYKNIDVLKDCLNSIKKYNDIGDELEVIVVDNSPSKDYIFNEIKRIYKDIMIIKSDNNGFGAGNNIGLRNSSGEYILFLNPDTILTEPIMGFAINKFEKDKKLGMFGLKLIDKCGKNNCSYFFDYKYDMLHCILLKIFNKTNLFLSSKMYISGANIFIRRDLFIRVGMFDENIFMYYEEPDLTRRVRQDKQCNIIRFFNNKQIIHLEGKSSDSSIKALETRLKSSVYYGSKYNLNIKKSLKGEFRYNCFKILIYSLFNKEKQIDFKKKNEIFIKYLNLKEEKERLL